MGHAFYGRPDWSGAASRAGRDSYACDGEWSAGGCACASGGQNRTTGGKQRAERERECGETGRSGTFRCEAGAVHDKQLLRRSGSD